MGDFYSICLANMGKQEKEKTISEGWINQKEKPVKHSLAESDYEERQKRQRK